VSDVEQFEILVVGSGEAGKYLAWTMAKAGHRTAMVERRWLGGSCPNIACLPSKNLIYSARVASLARRGAEFGLETNPLAVSMKDVQRRKRLMVEGLHQPVPRRKGRLGEEAGHVLIARRERESLGDRIDSEAECPDDGGGQGGQPPCYSLDARRICSDSRASMSAVALW